MVEQLWGQTTQEMIVYFFKGIKTCDKKAIILLWATMAIEKHLNIAYVAQSEETSWKI